MDRGKLPAGGWFLTGNRDDEMTETCIPEHHREDVCLFRVLDGVQPTTSAGPDGSADDSATEFLRRCNTQQNLTGASTPQIRRSLARAWHFMLASRVDEALGEIERIKLQLDDASPVLAKRFRAATQLLRAAGLAFQDDSLGALAIAVSHFKESGTNQDRHAASILCRLGFWNLGKFDSFYSLPRPQPRVQWSKSHAISAMLELSIEAAVALDHLHLSTARRLASDAATIAGTAVKESGGLAALPACLTAQVLYEEGSLDQAEMILRDRLPVINAAGPIESALRAYLVLARIAKHRMQYDSATVLLREAEALGERRGWPRLVAACLAERTSLLLKMGQVTEARLCFEKLDRCAELNHSRSGHCGSEILRYRTLTRWRLSRAKAPSGEAVAALRQIYHHCIENRNLYVGCELAVELAELLSVTGESEEADALFFHTIKVGAAAGLYQVFLEGGAELGTLLRRAYRRAEAPIDREVLPFVGSLLSRWETHCAEGCSKQPSSVSDTLTARECDILVMISQGLPNKRVARTLNISPETVKSHVKNIFSKLAVRTRTEAVSRAGSLGLL
jgi:ATP/maltotriose-dependent transcriptional regulator MalT